MPRPGTAEVMIGRKITRRFKNVALGGAIELRKNHDANEPPAAAFGRSCKRPHEPPVG